MKKTINKSHFEGLLYEVNLIEGTYKTGARVGHNYLRGQVSVMIAENDIVTVDFFEGEVTTKLTPNSKYAGLVQAMNAPNVVNDGVENAAGVRIDSALDLNDWYDSKRSKEMVSTLRSFGGFVHVLNKPEKFEATFKVDMLITSTTDELGKNAEGEMAPTGNLIVNGCFFDWTGQIFPGKFLVENEDAIDYFKNLEPNTFTNVEGQIHNRTYKTTKVEKSAFGADKVVEYTNSRKSYILTWAASEPYEFGEESILTFEEVTEALAARKIRLEELKTAGEQRAANGGNAIQTNAAPASKMDIKNAVFDL